jgi:hypothetical protein
MKKWDRVEGVLFRVLNDCGWWIHNPQLSIECDNSQRAPHNAGLCCVDTLRIKQTPLVRAACVLTVMAHR